MKALLVTLYAAFYAACGGPVAVDTATPTNVPQRPPFAATEAPEPGPTAVPTPEPTAVPTPRPLAHRLVGAATWYCLAGVSKCRIGYPDRSGIADYFAAAGPKLRAALGSGWYGRTVYVNGLAVRLIDSCGKGCTVLIDLYADAFRKLVGSTDPGRVTVTVRW